MRVGISLRHFLPYRYAAISRASEWVTPRFGMALPGFTFWGSRIQRAMFSGVLMRTPAI